MGGLPKSEESSKEEAIHTFGAPIAAPLPSHRGPLLCYHGNSDELAARPIITQPPWDPVRCSGKDVQKEICIPDPISCLLWLYLASPEKEKTVRALQRESCVEAGHDEWWGGSNLDTCPGRGGWTTSTCRGGVDLCEKKVTYAALLCEYWPSRPLVPSAESVIYCLLWTIKFWGSLFLRRGIFFCASSSK